ncbi:hypothetical protein K1719_015771 [Acacia pycnantha]|nr:hypothetical protein K1719_015771 [Acacia pycnantha]
MEVMVSNELTGSQSPPPHFAQNYSSLPSSPSRIPHFYSDTDYFLTVNDAQSAASSIQKAHNNDKDSDDDFAFSVSQDFDAASLTADELFDGGKIKTLKAGQFTSLTKSPIRSNRDDKGVDHVLSQKKIREPPEERRGRDSTPAALLPSNSGRRGTRSLSPYRVSQHAWDEEHEQRREQHQQHQGTREESSLSSKSSRKWKLRDLLLFRSASEGRGSGKDPLRKYCALYKKPEDVKSSTIDPTGSSRRGPTSPHEFHYTVKKAQLQDLKKKTFLPYKQGILGRLAGLGSHPR